MNTAAVRKIPDGSATASIAILVTAVLLSLAVIGGVIFTRAAFQGMFDEFGLKSSLTTKLALSPFFLVALFAGTVVLIVKEFALSNKRVTLAINLFYCPLLLVALAVYIVGLFLPMILVVQWP